MPGLPDNGTLGPFQDGSSENAELEATELECREAPNFLEQDRAAMTMPLDGVRRRRFCSSPADPTRLALCLLCCIAVAFAGVFISYGIIKSVQPDFFMPDYETDANTSSVLPTSFPITTSLENTTHAQPSVPSTSRLFGDGFFVPEFSPTATNLPEKRDDYDMSRWVDRGERLLQAIECNNGPDSQFTSINDLKAAGYETSEIETTTLEPLWEPFLKSINVDPSQRIYDWTSEQKIAPGDPDEEPDLGYYQQLVDPLHGIMVVASAFASAEPVPGTVKQASDILFLGWQDVVEQKHIGAAGPIKYYLVEAISNHDTGETIRTCTNQNVPKWEDRKTFTMDEDCGKALLGTPNGIALGYMIVNRRSAFPQTTVKSVTVFQQPYFPNLVFYLGPSEQPTESRRSASGAGNGSRQNEGTLLEIPRRNIVKRGPWDYNSQPFIDLANGLLEGIGSGCTWPSFYWDYEVLDTDGYVTLQQRTEFKDTWDGFLTDIGIRPRSEVREWAARFKTDQVDEFGDPVYDGGMIMQFDLDNGIMNMVFTYRPTTAPSTAIINLSDVVFLGWQEMAQTFAPDTKPLPKYYMLEQVVNMDTFRVVRSCTNSVEPPAWPGRLWSINEPCGKALLGSPSGRGIGYMIAQHLEVPDSVVDNKDEAITFNGVSITAVRVFGVDHGEMSMIFYLSHSTSLSGRFRRDVSVFTDSSTSLSVTMKPKSSALVRLRKRDSSKYLARGVRVLTAIRSQCANPSPWTDYSSIAAAGYQEFWNSDFGGMDLDNWRGFARQIGWTGLDSMDSVYFMRPKSRGSRWYDGRFQFYLDVERGIVLLTLTYRAMEPAPDTIVNLSDFIFLGWERTCRVEQVENPTINYFLVEDIINSETLAVITAYCFPGQSGHTGSVWPGDDFAIDTNCGKALLGSPSGVALGYLLAQHKDTFAGKTIGYVKILDFMGQWPCLIFYLGSLEQPPMPGAQPSDPPQIPDAPATTTTTMATTTTTTATTTTAASAMDAISSMSASRSAMSMNPTSIEPDTTLPPQSQQPRLQVLPVEEQASPRPPPPPQRHPLTKRASWNDVDISPFIEKGSALLMAIDAQCGPPTSWTEYSQLEETGWVVHDDDMRRSSISGKWLGFLTSIGVSADEEFIEWEAIAGMASAGDMQQWLDLERGIMLFVGTFRPPPPPQGPRLNRLSDVMFLGWQEETRKAHLVNPNINFVLIEAISNADTISVVKKCVGAETAPEWDERRTFLPSDDCGKALIGTPSGRGIAWMIINHQTKAADVEGAQSLTGKKIEKIVVFDPDPDVEMPHMIIYLTPDSGNAATTAATSKRRLTPDTAQRAASEVVKRAPFDFNRWRDAGARLVTLITNQDQCALPQSPWQGESFEPLDQYYTSDAKELEGNPKNLRNWQGFYESIGLGSPLTPWDFWCGRMRGGDHFDGTFCLHLQIQRGIMMMDFSYGPINPRPNAPSRLSDVDFLGWQLISSFYLNADPTINYFLREGIVNYETKQILDTCMTNLGKSYSHWPGLTVSIDGTTAERDCFLATLGSPNGNGCAWMIINHAKNFPRKTIRQVTIFDCTEYAPILTPCLIFPVEDLDPAAPVAVTTAAAATTGEAPAAATTVITTTTEEAMPANRLVPTHSPLPRAVKIRAPSSFTSVYRNRTAGLYGMAAAAA